MRTAYISNIQKFCVYDGPGIRTVVFFMGCPLRCRWCQNPENFNGTPVMMFDRDKCLECGKCIEVCSTHAIWRDGRGDMQYDAEYCALCGECARNCMQQAWKICGEKRTVEDVFHEVMKDEIFYRNTGGGITLSGGECTLFPEFAGELLERVKAKKIHTAIETCGFCSRDSLEQFIGRTDLFLYDLKLITPELHKRWTGQHNELIVSNLEYLVRSGCRVVIRIPLIEGINDGAELERMLMYLKGLTQVNEIHLLPFHQLGASKYRLSRQAYEMDSWDECPEEVIEKSRIAAEEMGFKVNVGGWNL